MSIVRFQYGIGTGRLLDGVTQIIFTLEFLVSDLPAGGHERLQATGSRILSSSDTRPAAVALIAMDGRCTRKRGGRYGV